MMLAAGCWPTGMRPSQPTATPASAEQQLRILREGDGEEWILAARSLSFAGDSRAIEPLMAALGSPQPDIRAEAAMGLGRLQVHAAVGRLAALLSDADPHVRSSAATALEMIADPAAMAALLNALDDPHPAVARDAAEALAAMGDPAVDALRDVLHHGSAEAKAMAARALRQMGEAIDVEEHTETGVEKNVEKNVEKGEERQ